MHLAILGYGEVPEKMLLPQVLALSAFFWDHEVK